MYLYIACPTEADQAVEDFSPLNVLPEAVRVAFLNVRNMKHQN